MSIKIVLRTLFISLLITIGIFVYLFRSTIFPHKAAAPTPTEKKISGEQESQPVTKLSSDRITEIEDTLKAIKEEQSSHEKIIDTLVDANKKNSQTTTTATGKDILDTAQATGGVFESSATTYASMGLYTNIKCQKSCNLIINFYTSSRNVDTSNALNTYGVFVNGQDKSIYTQGNIPDANSAVPMALNTTIAVGAGTHTVEIKAKTSGGKLQSDISGLQVIAVSQE